MGINPTPIYEWRYCIKDHLGNTRVLFTDKNGDGLINQSADEGLNEVLAFYKYAPFGLELGGSHQNGRNSHHRYQYNGKEWTDALNWYDYGARWYDPAVGRWGQVDPLAGIYASSSPYNYGLGNPIRFIDPDGRRVSSRQHLSVAEGGMGMDNTIFVDEKGNELGRTKDNLANAVVIIKNKDLSNFHQNYMLSLLSPEPKTDKTVDELRSMGNSYFTSDFDKLWDIGQKSRHPAGYNGIESTIGDGSWIPEVSVDANNSNGEILPDWETFIDHEDPVGNMHFYIPGTSYWHTHPNGRQAYKFKQRDGTYRVKRGVYENGGPPSAADFNQIRNHNMNGLYNVAVLKTGYYFFDNRGNEFFVSQNEFDF